MYKEKDATKLCSLPQGHWSFFQVTPCWLWPSQVSPFIAHSPCCPLEKHWNKVWPQWFIQGHVINRFLYEESKMRTLSHVSVPDGCSRSSAHSVANFSGKLWSSAYSHTCLQNPTCTCMCECTYTQLFPCSLALCHFLQANVDVKVKSAN